MYISNLYRRVLIPVNDTEVIKKGMYSAFIDQLLADVSVLLHKLIIGKNNKVILFSVIKSR